VSAAVARTEGAMAALLRFAQRASFAAPSARRFASSAAEPLDLVVVGGGPGGYVAAIKAAQLGMSVACVEGRGTLGGTCLNVGCIPSKALLHTTHLYHDAQKNFKKHGIEIEGAVKVNVAEMMKSKEKAVGGLTKGIEGLFKKNKVKYVKGWGKLAGKGDTVEVALADGGSETLTTKNVLLATGSTHTDLPGITIDEEKIVSSTGALSLKEVPKKMVVIGGGVIGLEMGSVWSRLGAQVTVVEFTDGIVPSLDSQIRTTFERTLKKQGFKFKYKTKVTGAVPGPDGVKLTMEPSAGGEPETMDVDVVLVATGRRPYTDGLGLKEAGVEQDKAGRVIIEHDFKTNVPGVWAIGDIVAGPMLAHKAEEEGIAAVENMLGKAGHINYDTVPGIIYTHPEVATVGMTEDEAKAKGLDYMVGTFPFAANSRARANEDADGIVKFVSDKKTDKVLGAHIVGPNAGELIAECVLAIEYGAATEDIARTCHGHPTLSEAVKEAALATGGKPIHF